jgi:hypothetical protein
MDKVGIGGCMTALENLRAQILIERVADNKLVDHNIIQLNSVGLEGDKVQELDWLNHEPSNVVRRKHYDRSIQDRG